MNSSGRAIPDRPAALHATHRAPARLRVDDLGHQHGSRRPLTSEAEALQAAEHHHLFAGIGRPDRNVKNENQRIVS
jgi:hypothetical protein